MRPKPTSPVMTMNKGFALLRFIRLFCLSLLVIPMAGAQSYSEKICDPREYAALVAYSQSVNPLADALGRKLLECSRQDYREAAVFWLSFYLEKSGQGNKIPGIRVPTLGAVTEKDKLQQSALQGEPTALAQRVQSGDDRYANDPWILLSLARGQMRAKQYTQAFQTYQQILAIREGQEGVEIELLFAYIWAGDEPAARAKIAALRRYEMAAYMRQSVDRAEVLLGGPKVERKPFPNLTPESLEPWITLGYLLERDNRGYSEQGGVITYNGPVELEVEALEHKSPLEEHEDNFARVNLKKVWAGQNTAVSRTLALGYISPGDSHITGELSGRYAQPESIAVGFGFKRESVAVVAKPPGGDRVGLMRDSFFWSAGWGEWVDFQGAIHKEESKAVFEDYALAINVKHAPELANGFGVYIPVRYSFRPMPSPDYRTYPREYRLGVGFRLNLTDARRYLIRSDAVVESVQRNDYGELKHFEQLLGGHISLHARYYYQKAFYQYLEASGGLLERGTGERSDEKSAAVLLGVGFGEAGH